MNQAVHVSEQYRRQKSGLNLKRLLSWTAIVLALVISWRTAEIRPAAFFEPGALTSVLAFVRGLFPPDLSVSFLRVSTVLGLVGGGGLGLLIYNNVQLGFYPRVSTLIAIVYILVVTTNWLGDRLRPQRVAL